MAMRPLGSPAELEKRRWRAIDLLKSGLSISGVARRLGCSHSSFILRRGRAGRDPWEGCAAAEAQAGTGPADKTESRSAQATTRRAAARSPGLGVRHGS